MCFEVFHVLLSQKISRVAGSLFETFYLLAYFFLHGFWISEFCDLGEFRKRAKAKQFVKECRDIPLGAKLGVWLGLAYTCREIHGRLCLERDVFIYIYIYICSRVYRFTNCKPQTQARSCASVRYPLHPLPANAREPAQRPCEELIMKHSAFVGFPIDLRMEHRKAQPRGNRSQTTT